MFKTLQEAFVEADKHDANYVQIYQDKDGQFGFDCFIFVVGHTMIYEQRGQTPIASRYKQADGIYVWYSDEE